MHAWVHFTSIYMLCIYSLSSYPGPAQLFVACSKEKLFLQYPRFHYTCCKKKSKNEQTRLKYAEVQEPSDLVCKLLQ